MEYARNYKSPLGELILVSDGKNLTELWIKEKHQYDKSLIQKLNETENLKIFNETEHWLDDYFNNKKPNPKALKMKLKGSDFDKKVWAELLKIPYGETVAYGDIAKVISNKMSAQAVGGAVGRNPISIIVPCHRVIGKTKKLTGYGGGIENKIKLLKHEGYEDFTL